MPAVLADDLRQLLQRPVRCWIRRHAHIHQATRSVLDDNERVEHPESCRDGNQDIARQYPLGVILQERRPAQVSMRLPRYSLWHVLEYGSWRHLHPELDQQFVHYPFLTPERILTGHPANQRPQFRRDWGPTCRTLPAQEEPRSQSVPSNNGRRTNNDHCLSPIEQPGEQRKADTRRPIRSPGLIPRSMYLASCLRRTTFSARITEAGRSNRTPNLNPSPNKPPIVRASFSMITSCQYGRLIASVTRPTSLRANYWGAQR